MSKVAALQSLVDEVSGVSPVKISSQESAERLDAVLAVAMDAAITRATRQAEQVIGTARLATAVHMGRAAEHAAADARGAACGAGLNHEAASDDRADAARLARWGEVL
jgi:hypothetical protein